METSNKRDEALNSENISTQTAVSSDSGSKSVVNASAASTASASSSVSSGKTKKKSNWFTSLGKNMHDYPELYLMLLPYLVWVLIFQYGPMYGVLIAFKDYKPSLGVTRSPWADMHGFKHFYDFLTLPTSRTLILNTLRVSIANLIFSFPLTIILALMFNQVTRSGVRKTYQTISYIPNFISTVVIVGIMEILLNKEVGVINQIIAFFGNDRVDFMNSADYFVFIYVISGIWAGVGWSSIIYTGALTNINPELYEAARIDGATKWQQIHYIDWPNIAPLVSVSLIMSIGGIMSVGWEKAYLLQSPQNLSVSQLISTYTYQVGIINRQYEYSTAIGLFNSVVNLVLLLIANSIAKATGNGSIF